MKPVSCLRNIWAYRRIIALTITVVLVFVFYAFRAQTNMNAHWGHGSSAVGALFVRAVGITVNNPFCTASIVPSPKGNLLITAGHCLGEVPVDDMTFAPFYHDGIRPFGTWRVISQVFAPQWIPGGDPDADFAFLTVNGNVQKLAGAEQLGLSSPVPASVTVEGYLFAGGMTVCAQKPVIIYAANQKQLKLNCSGFPNGSSGGPFLKNINKRSGLGTIVGVIGGYQEGGNNSNVEYSSPISSSLMSLYKEMIQRD